MKRTLRLGMALLVLGGLLTTAAAAQSLGEYARQQRAKKPATPAGAKVYTNDNLPTSGGLSTAGSASPPSGSVGAGESKTDTSPAQDRSKQEAEWRAKFAAQKDVIATLQRELDVATQENNNRQAQAQVNTYDVGARLRNPVLFAAENKKYQDEMEGKKKDLEAAKQKLEDMKDDLRKAGFPSSWAD